MIELFHQGLWYVRQSLYQLGLWGIIGCSLIMFTGVSLYLSSNTIQSSQTILKHPSQHIQATSLKNKQEDNPSQIDSKSNEILPILALLPKEKSLPNILYQIYQQSKQVNLNIASAEYKWRKVKKTTLSREGSLVQYEITFPLTGHYREIRNMVNGVLANIPTLSLEAISLERESAESDFAEAKVTFVVFMLGDIE